MSEALAIDAEASSYEQLRADNAALRERNEELQRQVNWFKRQIFGPRPEKRFRDSDDVIADLFAGEGTTPPQAPEKQKHTYERTKPGTLLSDGYSAYTCFARVNQQVSHAQCWSHARRPFLEAEDSEPEAVTIALEYISVLYQHEAAIWSAVAQDIDIEPLNLDELGALNEHIVELIRYLKRSHVFEAMQRFNIGARVRFYPGHHDTQTRALTKYNQKSVTILGDDQRQWRVTPYIVESLDAGWDRREPRARPAPLSTTAIKAASRRSGKITYVIVTVNGTIFHVFSKHFVQEELRESRCELANIAAMQKQRPH